MIVKSLVGSENDPTWSIEADRVLNCPERIEMTEVEFKYPVLRERRLPNRDLRQLHSVLTNSKILLQFKRHSAAIVNYLEKELDPCADMIGVYSGEFLSCK
jgi:hypothetical protein